MRKTEQNNIGEILPELERIVNLITNTEVDYEILHEYDASQIYVELSRGEARENLTEDKELFEKCFEISTAINNLAGLINSGKNQDDIRQQLDYFTAEINTITNEDGLKKYVQQWMFSVEALYYYRTGDFEKAISLTYQAIEIIDKLITEYKIYSFIFRLVLQYSNLSNVYFKINDFDTALTYREEILNYLFRGSCTLPARSFKNDDLWNEMAFIREYNAIYFFKTTVDRLNTLKKKDMTTYAQLFKRTIDPLDNIEVMTLERYYISTWIRIESEFINQNFDTFLHLVEDFFEGGINSFFKFLVVYILESIEIISGDIDLNPQGLLKAKLKYQTINEDLFHEKQL